MGKWELYGGGIEIDLRIDRWSSDLEDLHEIYDLYFQKPSQSSITLTSGKKEKKKKVT